VEGRHCLEVFLNAQVNGVLGLMIPCILFEDEHLLVVNKPAGLNTHAPSPFAGEGIYDWLRHREPRWANLAIIHRLDKETSGVMVFGKTALANRSLTDQFTERMVQKKYLLLTDHEPKQREFTAKSKIIRAGDRYTSSAKGDLAETRFQLLDSKFEIRNSKLVEASPLTGRTHQIRVHAAENGFPILGDTLYGGTPFPRVCLYAVELAFRHPVTNELLTFSAAADFSTDPRMALRTALINPKETNAFRIIHGASDGWPGLYVEQLGDFILSQSETELTNRQNAQLIASGTPSTRSARIVPEGLAEQVLGVPARGTYHKILSRQVRRAAPPEASPKLVSGEVAPEKFTIRENGVEFELSFNEGYSVGLFLDQRDNRRRLLTGHVAADFSLFDTEHGTRNTKPELLNVFAYTCAFSVCAVKTGARTTSLDLSKKYLEWGKRNFALNGLNPHEHDFIYGDAFDWMRRLAKKNRAFDIIVLDPPTFSQSKEHGAFRVEKDFGKLVAVALPLLKPNGVLLASTNAADWEPEEFLAVIEESIRAGRRKILQKHYVPQPLDFPISRAEPAYLKTVWLRIG
jgi:23S rRNA (cytosine1962-C5)-methyltransferase